jgi:hypothetical protein
VIVSHLRRLDSVQCTFSARRVFGDIATRMHCKASNGRSARRHKGLNGPSSVEHGLVSPRLGDCK